MKRRGLNLVDLGKIMHIVETYRQGKNLSFRHLGHVYFSGENYYSDDKFVVII